MDSNEMIQPGGLLRPTPRPMTSIPSWPPPSFEPPEAGLVMSPTFDDVVYGRSRTETSLDLPPDMPVTHPRDLDVLTVERARTGRPPSW